MRAITSRGVFGAALSFACASIAGLALASGPPVNGQAAPLLKAQSFGGAPIDLGALRGKVVVLNFWASWCEPCRHEMPLLEALSHDFPDRVVVIGLSADDRHDRKDALNASRSVSYPTGLLADAQINEFGPPAVLPLTYVIDGAGRIAAVLRASQGALTDTQLRSAVSSALNTAPMP